jgi:hypothetical protein
MPALTGQPVVHRFGGLVIFVTLLVLNLEAFVDFVILV